MHNAKGRGENVRIVLGLSVLLASRARPPPNMEDMDSFMLRGFFSFTVMRRG